jgi:hypothetical protein
MKRLIRFTQSVTLCVWLATTGCIGLGSGICDSNVCLPPPQASCSGLGNTWSTVDDYTYDPSAQSALNALSSMPNGDIVTAGTITDGTTGVWLTRTSSDGGNSWANIDSLTSTGTPDPVSILINPYSSGLLVGGIDNLGNTNRSIIFRTGTAQGNFSTANSFLVSGATELDASGFTFDPAGNLFVSAYALEGPNLHWLVLKCGNLGGSCGVIDDYQYAAGADSFANGIAADSSGNIYSIGVGTDSSGTEHWLVREFNGTSSILIDDFVAPSGINNLPQGIAIDSFGNVVVAGYGDATGYDGYDWLVRRLVGGTWETIDDYHGPSDGIDQAVGIAVDRLGDIVVVGEVTPGGNPTWMTRVLKQGQSAFSTIDRFEYPGNASTSGARAVAIDASFNVFVGGYGNSSNEHWVVRKLPCQ